MHYLCFHFDKFVVLHDGVLPIFTSLKTFLKCRLALNGLVP